ncbi:DUF2530 domain-containing protein [Kineococcus gynurae]|uniref:DUF2530 domain-containing protein n=1 Tax=Kineococcus gynurae TaxID=452979 RepID=A0ABV5LWG8_9ACTN
MPLFLPPSRAKTPPPPVVTNDRRAVAVGMAVWAVLLVLALLAPGSAPGPRGLAAWTCVAGLGLGALALAYLHRRRHRSTESNAAD